MTKGITNIALVLMAGTLMAFPTREELKKAGTLVDKLMEADLAAARAGKKTHEQVADAAMALADEAEKPAEKYLLLTGAFEEYMKDGAFDQANDALEELRRTLPDWSRKEEFALLDKAIRAAGYGKGGPVRERWESLKERQQFTAKLRKAQQAAKKEPSNRKLQFQLGAYQAALGDWPAAVEALAKGSNEAIRKAAELEINNEPPHKVADAWSEVGDVKPQFLAEAIAEHAVSLYKKALKDDKFTGLNRVAAERKVEEWEKRQAARTEVVSESAKGLPNVGRARTVGVQLVGGSVKERNGVLSGFADTSYAKIKVPFSPGKETIEAVVEFTMGEKPVVDSAILTGVGKQDGFSPFYIKRKQVCGYLSSKGAGWNITDFAGMGFETLPNKTYRVKCTWDGGSYDWWIWANGQWRKAKTVKSIIPVFSGMELQLGTNRGMREPFNGTVNLNRSYICIGGKLWWEGVKGAYMKANR